MPRFKLKRKTSAKRTEKPSGTRTPRAQGKAQGLSASLWEALFDELSGGATVAEVCSANEGWPAARVIHRAISADVSLMERYKAARRAAIMAVSEELLTIADDGRNDWVEKETGVRFDNEHVQRSRLRIDARFRLLEALQPETFGKKLDLSNKDGTLASAWSQALGAVNAEKVGATKH